MFIKVHPPKGEGRHQSDSQYSNVNIFYNLHKEMNYRLCYLSRNYRGVRSSGNKAKTDNEVSLRELGAHVLGLPTSYYESKVLTFFFDLAGVLKLSLTARRGDIIVLQYPVKKYFTLVCRMAHLHGACVVALVHDLGSMRRRKLTVPQEIARMMHADYVIASNDTMRQWLLSHGYAHPLGALQLFDYRSHAVAPARRDVSLPEHPRVVYAGALAPRKNTFLLEVSSMPIDWQLEIYGNQDGLPGLKSEGPVHVHPFMAPEDFIAGRPGDFGLVWDGDSLTECSGNFGEYLRWNSPHKASFYLRAGLPLIVWRQSALAPIVESCGIGICVNSLQDINDALRALTPECWQTMLAHVAQVDRQLRTGFFFKQALDLAIKELKGE